MKWAGFLVEEAPEFAKDLVWERREQTLSDQLYIFTKQWQRVERLRGQVDYVVTDSPIMLGIVYSEKAGLLNPEFRALVYRTFLSLPNLNFMLCRTKPYETAGRLQTEEEARSLDTDIADMLNRWKIEYEPVLADSKAADTIISRLKEWT